MTDPALPSSISPHIHTPDSVELNLRRIGDDPVPNFTIEALPSGKIRVTKQTGPTTSPEVYDYECTVFKGSANVTGSRDWGEIASVITKLFVTAAGKPIEAGQIKLAGDFRDIAAVDLKDKNVKIVSANVTYHDDGAHEWKSKTYERESEVALKDLNHLGEEFKSRAPVTTSAPPSATRTEPLVPTLSSPQAATASAPQAESVPEYEDMVDDDRIAACKNRNKGTVQIRLSESSAASFKTSAIYALADQLSKMKNHGRTQFNAKTHDEIITELRNTISQDLKNYLNVWKGDSTLFFQALKNIETDPHLVQSLHTVDLNETMLNNILSKNPVQLTEIEKEKLIKLYAEYIQNGGEKLDDLFFKVFIASYKFGDNAPDFQVVIIEGNGTTTDRALSYPTSTIIDARRCVFVYRNTTNTQYESYERGNPFDLNNPTGDNTKYLHITPTATTTRRLKTPTPATASTTSSAPQLLLPAAPVPVIPRPNVRVPGHAIATSFQTQECGGDGLCFDKSIAYQLLKKQQPEQVPQQSAIDEAAQALRNQVATYIRDEAVRPDQPVRLYNDDTFADLLYESIRGSNWDALTLRVKEIIHNEEHTSLDPQVKINARKELMQHYASAITQPAQWIDSAFAYVIPKVFSDTQIVIVQGEQPSFIASEHTILDPEKAIFVNYDGVGHYKAIDMSNEENKEKIAKLIIVNYLNNIEMPEHYDSGAAKEALIKMKDNPLTKDAYNEAARLIYHYDHAHWETERVLPEPRGDKYADDRIALRTTPEQLVILLKELSPQIRSWATVGAPT